MVAAVNKCQLSRTLIYVHFFKCDYKIVITSRLLEPCSDTHISSLVKGDRHPSEIFVTLTVDSMYENRVQRRDGSSCRTVGLERGLDERQCSLLYCPSQNT